MPPEQLLVREYSLWRDVRLREQFVRCGPAQLGAGDCPQRFLGDSARQLHLLGSEADRVHLGRATDRVAVGRIPFGGRGLATLGLGDPHESEADRPGGSHSLGHHPGRGRQGPRPGIVHGGLPVPAGPGLGGSG